MKAFIASLLFLALLGIRIPASFAQQDQSYQKLAQEMESLRRAGLDTPKPASDSGKC